MPAVTILGSTGSIGVSTLDVISGHPEKFSVYALTANANLERLAEQCVLFRPVCAVVMQAADVPVLRELLSKSRHSPEILVGVEGLAAVAEASETDVVVAAIVGAAGLEPTMAAVRAGKKVLLANKESLVMSGKLFTDAVAHNGAELLPVDSEHNAIFQCLPAGFSSLKQSGVRKILLTGSGGPFRDTPLDALSSVTPEQAVAHPNWSMGKKISVDSSTMMNKGLEFIEACWLFKAQVSDIEVVIHPQSIIHSMVEFLDGSVLSQMGRPDMRTPIAHCLGWPERINSGVDSLDLFELASLEFSRPDFARFPCLKMAIEAMSAGGTYPAALNAANEVAVEHFLNNRIGYLQIAQVIETVVSKWNLSEPDSLAAVIEADAEARRRAERVVLGLKSH